ncbi:Uncharacterized protein BN1224_Wien3_A_00070 [Chlamydia pneumoniae]|nr:Uncharacterized protein CWL029c_A_00070 [Chlamydia pneumoniae]CRI41006.1 Uncharacterized protein BN1224_GiD_A_00070 [Chlamydia pneumoniae]CRI43228.1 Uncharacterized protein BN1224_H12_AA_00070 [Chlamydia pneumoniae]CRI52575.1 Uncharacterized protein BN1224_Wien3_A_00070 [Chlamydia pneumoniae]
MRTIARIRSFLMDCGFPSSKRDVERELVVLSVSGITTRKEKMSERL